MKIEISAKLQPFSHTPGTFCLLPGSSYTLQIFPALVRVYDLSLAQPQLTQEIPITIQGPVKEFTVLADLENRCVCVSGKSENGFFRYRLFLLGSIVSCHQDRGGALFAAGSEFKKLSAIAERLSLGNHKLQDWDLVIRRENNLGEIFPIWNRLGNLMLSMQFTTQELMEGSLLLLKNVREVIEKKLPECIYPAFQVLLRAGFHGIMTPRLIDDQYQGILPATKMQNHLPSPLSLLKEGSELIRSLFIQDEEGQLMILPVLPPEFHCGRYIQVSLGDWGICDMEWSKKVIRRFILYAKKSMEKTIHFRHVASYRLRKNEKERGVRIKVGTSLVMQENTCYLFDNFQ